MRLPALSYGVESVLGAAVVLLAVIVFTPDVPKRPAAKPAPAPAPVEPPRAIGPAGGAGDAVAFVAAEARRRARSVVWAAHLAETGEAVADYWPRRIDVRAAHLMAFRADLVGAFEGTPGRGVPWADRARAVLDVRARMLAAEQLGGDIPEALRDEETRTLAQAIDAGCDDPLVRYWQARHLTNEGADDPGAFRAAVERVVASPYPPARRLPAVLKWLWVAQGMKPGDPLRDDLAAWEARFWELFEGGVRVRTLVGDEDIADTARAWQTYRIRHGGTRAAALAELDRHIRRAGGRDYLRRTVRGEGLVFLAWDARGSGFADGVREDAWEVFRGHLAEAREVLTDACDADPDGTSAPARLLSVFLGLGADPGEVDDAFRRALHANPDSWLACNLWLEFRHPKWHGSRDGGDYLAGCWALAAAPGDGAAQAALLANLLANHPVSGPGFDADRLRAAAFYGTDDVFDMVSTACAVLEAHRAKDAFYPFLLTRVAVIGRQYGLARELFFRAGPTFSRKVYRDQAEFDAFRREAGIIP